MGEQAMNWKKAGVIAGVSAGVFLGMKYVFPVILPFFLGWILAEAVYKPANWICKKTISQRIHLSKSILATIFIIFGVSVLLVGMSLVFQYVAGKLCECVKYYPEFQQGAQDILQKFCQSVEKVTGISADKSCVYICQQIDLFWGKVFSGKNSMNTAIVSVKGCASFVGIFVIAIIFSILFLQERDRVYGFFSRWKIFGNITHILKEMTVGIKAYLKAQFKIVITVCLLCVGGLWILKVRHYVSMGMAIGIFDAFPVLGTGTFLIPAAVIMFIQGKEKMGFGLFIIYLFTTAVRQFLEPRLVGNHIGISPLLVFLSVYLGIILYGGFGFLLGPVSIFLIHIILKECDFF